MFKHWNDCQKFEESINNKIELKILKSYRFDSLGNLINSFVSKGYEPEELTEFAYLNNHLTEKAIYIKTDIDSIFDIYKSQYFCDNSGRLQKRIVLNYYPRIYNALIDEKNDSPETIKNAKEFLNPAYNHIRDVNTPSNFDSINYPSYPKTQMVKMKDVYAGQGIDTAMVDLYTYNSKGQLITQIKIAEGHPWNPYGGTYNYIYDKKKRLKEISYYYNPGNLKRGFQWDSVRSWNSYFEYFGNRNFTETLVSKDRILKKTYFINRKGQITKTINEDPYYSQIQFINGKYVPSLIDKFDTRTITIFEYDKFGRIIKSIFNFETTNKDPYTTQPYQNITIFKYKDDGLYKLPIEEYIDTRDVWHE